MIWKNLKSLTLYDVILFDSMGFHDLQIYLQD